MWLVRVQLLVPECESGGMVYTADLKSAGRKAIRVRVPSLAPHRFRIMDNTAGFYPANMGSIPVGGAR